MKFKDIPQFPQTGYGVDVSWSMLEDWIAHHDGAILDPVYQRSHVWTKEQQVAYVEYVLSGGEGQRVLYWNHPSWMRFNPGDKIELVDGKQRLEAARAFLRNEVPAFGHLYREFEDKLGWSVMFHMKVGNLKTREDVINWYLGINAGGTPHTKQELDRVRELLK